MIRVYEWRFLYPNIDLACILIVNHRQCSHIVRSLMFCYNANLVVDIYFSAVHVQCAVYV